MDHQYLGAQQANTAQQTAGYANSKLDRPPTLTSSTLGRLESLQQSLAVATANAQAVCDRLWGQNPEVDPRSGGLSAVRTGAHGELDSRLDSLEAAASNLIGLTCRLEQGI